MPKPKDGESKDDFVKRCIPMVLEDGSASDNEQAVAMCNTMYSGKSACDICNGTGTVVSEVRNSQGGKSTHVKECTACKD